MAFSFRGRTHARHADAAKTSTPHHTNGLRIAATETPAHIFRHPGASIAIGPTEVDPSRDWIGGVEEHRIAGFMGHHWITPSEIARKQWLFATFATPVERPISSYVLDLQCRSVRRPQFQVP